MSGYRSTTNKEGNNILKQQPLIQDVYLIVFTWYFFRVAFDFEADDIIQKTICNIKQVFVNHVHYKVFIKCVKMIVNSVNVVKRSISESEDQRLQIYYTASS